MTRVTKIISRLLRDEQGVTAIEYSLIAAVLGIALIPVLTNTTSGIASLFVTVQMAFDTFK